MFNYRVFIPALLLLTACSKDPEVLLPGPPDAAINFYNASEVMALPALAADNFIYIDDTAKKYASFPYATDHRQFPDFNPSYAGYRLFSWMRIPAGTHRLILTGHANFPVSDTSVFIPQDSHRSIYLSESPEGDAAYRLLVVPEERMGIAGKVRIRFVHLSPDAGALRCFRNLPEGEQTTAGLPQDMAYGTATPYVALDTNGTAQTRGNIILRLVEQNNPDNVVLSTGVPALPGSSFVLLLQGFRQPATRRLHTRVNSNGTFTDTSVAVQANLRINVRRSY